MNAAEELVDLDCGDEVEVVSADTTDDYDPPFLTKVGTMIAAPFVYAAMLPLAGLGLAMGWILRSNEKHRMEMSDSAHSDKVDE